MQTATKKTHNVGTFYHRKDCTRIKQTQTDKDTRDIITSSSTSTRLVGTDPILENVSQSTPTCIKAKSPPAKTVHLFTSANPYQSSSNTSLNVIDSVSSLCLNYIQEESMTSDLSHTLDKSFNLAIDRKYIVLESELNKLLNAGPVHFIGSATGASTKS